jgi:hypothetical protein
VCVAAVSGLRGQAHAELVAKNREASLHELGRLIPDAVRDALHSERSQQPSRTIQEASAERRRTVTMLMEETD